MKSYTQWAVVVYDHVAGLAYNKASAWAKAREYLGTPSDEWFDENGAKCIRVRITEVKSKKRKAKK